MDPRSASYRVESEREEEEIPTVSRRLDYERTSAAPSRTGASDGEVNDFNDITLIPTNIRESSGMMTCFFIDKGLIEMATLVLLIVHDVKYAVRDAGYFPFVSFQALKPEGM